MTSLPMLTSVGQRALQRLRNYVPPPTSWGTAPVSRRAAVLILLFPDKSGELRVVLTMRASTLSSYSGQAALPGGKADGGEESPFAVARREAEEEIGLPREPALHTASSNTIDHSKRRLPKGFWVEELCEMPTNLAKTELVVRPCVAFLHNSATVKSENGQEIQVEGGSVEENMLPRLDAREVAAVFSAPFRNFLYDKDLAIAEGEGLANSANLPPGPWYKGTWTDWHQQRWRMHNFFVPVTNQPVHKPKHIQNDGPKTVIDQLDGLQRFKVWGMTARILVDAARFAYDQDPIFEHNAHFGDENMIGRLRKVGKLGDIRRPGEVLTREDLRKAANL